MKKSIIFFVILITFGNYLYSQEALSTLSFEERIFDFGDILEKNGKISHTFIFKNIGRTPVVVSEVVSGCGCTSHKYSPEPVAADKKGTVTVTYDPLYRPGFFSKEILIYSNGHKHINRIWITGKVIPFLHPVEEDYPYNFGSGLYLNLKVLAFGKVAKGKTKEIELRYANDRDKPMTLRFEVVGDKENLIYTNPKQLAAKERGKMIFTYSMKKSIRGEMVVNVYPIVNGKRLAQPLIVRVFEEE
ncbi:hypothetical protein EZS27_000252 [termite gut metagenome]|uniref:DUF1573 domain-containing protein n=1 Tax=termite gut metagenome TaxID=433724 RepID=A0A5J4T314_9ZZZZ